MNAYHHDEPAGFQRKLFSQMADLLDNQTQIVLCTTTTAVYMQLADDDGDALWTGLRRQLHGYVLNQLQGAT